MHVKNVSCSLGGDHIGGFCGGLKEELVAGTREVVMVMERSGQMEIHVGTSYLDLVMDGGRVLTQ